MIMTNSTLLPHFGKAVVISNVVPTTSWFAKRSFSLLQRLKTEDRQNCLNHLALLCTECAYAKRIYIEKVINEFVLKKRLFQVLFLTNF